MRVITGCARGLKLASPTGLDIRPTAEMTKEALFSILQNEIAGAAVLDLFAGSGQLGIEAISRGARLCVFVDHARQAQETIRENLSRTSLAEKGRLVATDCLSFLAHATEHFDIALLDPPYQNGLLEKALPLTAALMQKTGVIICECPHTQDLPQQMGHFICAREYRYGKTKLLLYRCAPDAPEEE